MCMSWNVPWSKNIGCREKTRRKTKTWKVKASWNRRAKEFSPGAVGNAARWTAHAWEGRGLGRGLWGGSPGQRTAQTKAYEGHDPGQYCAARDEMAQGDQNTSRNVSPGEARHIWRRRSVSPLHGRAHRLERHPPLRGVLVPMDLTCDLRHAARNGARRVAARLRAYTGRPRGTGPAVRTA